MAKFQIAALAAGLLLAVSGPAFAAKHTSKHTSRTKGAAQSQSHAVAPGNSTNSGMRAYGRVPYDRDDPYAPGVNWPGHW